MGDRTETSTTDDVQHERPLRGWKSIAGELGVSESWAETTGRANGLPVRQVGSAIFAYPSELHAWLRSAPMASAAPAPARLRVVGGR